MTGQCVVEELLRRGHQVRALCRSEGMAAIYGVASTIWHPLYRKYMRVMLNGACGDALTGSHLTPNLLLAPKRAEATRLDGQRCHTSRAVHAAIRHRPMWGQ